MSETIRTPSPFRRRSDRRSILRTLPLSPIGDIGTATLTEEAEVTLLWETATDWDNATSELGTVHESTTNTDHNDATIVKKGFKAANPLNTGLVLYWPFHEDSGSTAYDFSGNNFDGSIGSNVTVGQSGVLGTTSFKHPSGVSEGSSSDYVSIPHQSAFNSDTLTVAGWVNLSTKKEGGIIHRWAASNAWVLDINDDGTGEMRGRWVINDGSTQLIEGSTLFNTGEWYHVAGTWNDGTLRIYTNGTEENSASGFGTIQKPSQELVAGMNAGTTADITDGRLADLRVYDRVLSQSEIQELADTVNNESQLTTGTKSYAESKAPDLTDLVYSLNGETITIDVIGSPGTASEEVVSQTLDGASSYTLSWSNTHTDFRVKPRMSVADQSVTPTVDRIGLTG